MSNVLGLAGLYFIVLYPFPGPGTSPIRFVSKIRAILEYLCVRSSDIVFYLHKIHFRRFSGQPLGETTFSKKGTQNENLTIILKFQCPKRVFVENLL